MSLELVFKRYVYLTDRDCFYDVQAARDISEIRLIKLLCQFIDSEKLSKTIQAMKDAGQDSLKIKKAKPSMITRVRQSYNAIKPVINIRKGYNNGNPILYTVNERNEVTMYGDCDKNLFAELCLNDPKIHEAILMEYEYGIHSSIYLNKVSPFMFIQSLFEHFTSDSSMLLTAEPQAISWDPAIPAFKRLDASLLMDGPTPSWDSFLSRMDHPETFKAYVWGAFDPRNTGRQCMWIQGEGLDGKSSAMNAISSFLGRKFVLSIAKGSYNKDFFYGSAFGKRIAIYMDCKNLQLLRTEAIKSLLGKDTVDVNRKFQNSFSGQIYAKLFVGSNFFPQINYYDNSERSRLLLVRVSTYKDQYGDSDFEYNLEREFAHFLYKCRLSYETECPNHNNIKVPKVMAKNIELLCSSEESDAMVRFRDEHLIFEENAKEESYKVKIALKDYLQKHQVSDKASFSSSELDRMLLRKFVTVLIDGHKKFYVGVKLKPR